MKSTGLVFKSRDYIGSAQPPATVLEDESRYGGDGTITTATRIQLPSGLWVMSFNGATPDYVEVADSASLDTVSSALSMGLWANTSSLATEELLMGKGGAFNRIGYTCTIRTNGNFRFIIGTGAAETKIDNSTLVVDTWYHLVVTFDGTTMKAYINGVLQATTATPGAWTLETNYAFRMGASDNANLLPYTGLQEKWRLYNYSLSAEQIAAIFQAERHWFGV